jgi:hypothetical protein
VIDSKEYLLKPPVPQPQRNNNSLQREIWCPMMSGGSLGSRPQFNSVEISHKFTNISTQHAVAVSLCQHSQKRYQTSTVCVLSTATTSFLSTGFQIPNMTQTKPNNNAKDHKSTKKGGKTPGKPTRPLSACKFLSIHLRPFV